MKRLFLALTAVLLAGCSTVSSFDNRVSCSLDKQEAYVNSMYGPLGVTSKIDKRDAQVICAPGKP